MSNSDGVLKITRSTLWTFKPEMEINCISLFRVRSIPWRICMTTSLRVQTLLKHFFTQAQATVHGSFCEVLDYAVWCKWSRVRLCMEIQRQDTRLPLNTAPEVTLQRLQRGEAAVFHHDKTAAWRGRRHEIEVHEPFI